MAFVQKIEFVLSYEQIIRMIKLRETQGIRITLGVTETAEIVILCDGIKRDSQTREIISQSATEPVCPVPPGCPTDPACVAKFNVLLPEGITSEELLNYEGIHTLFPNL